MLSDVRVMRHLPAGTAALLLIGAGAGAVAVSPAYAADTTCEGQAATMVATADGESLQGSEDADVIVVGDVRWVRVDGNGGDDVICAAAGSGAMLSGGAGDDVLMVLPSKDEVYPSSKTVLLGGGSGADDLVGARDTELSYEESTVGVAVDLGDGTAVYPGGSESIAGIHRVIGSAFADTFRGTSGADYFTTSVNVEPSGGGSGGDRVMMGGGPDEVRAEHAQVDLGSGDDRGWFRGGDVDGGAGDDDLFLAEPGLADGGAGDDILTAYVSWADSEDQDGLRLAGGPGDDVLRPPSTDTVYCAKACAATGAVDGGSGRDLLDIRFHSQVKVDLGKGRIRLKGGRSSVTGVEDVRGSANADVIRGDKRANRFHGGGGNDLLDGRRGSDRLYGGSGRDRALGGPGRDRCVAERRSSC